MRPWLCLPLLLACGDPIDGFPWEGTCEATTGTIAIETTNLVYTEQPLVGFEGEADRYRAAATLIFPGSEQETGLEFLHCLDPDGCSTPLADFDKGDGVAIFTDSADSVPVFASGPFDSAKSMTGTCQTSFGNGAFAFSRAKSKE